MDCRFPWAKERWYGGSWSGAESRAASGCEPDRRVPGAGARDRTGARRRRRGNRQRRELPEAIVAALVERGLFRLLLPRSLDGAELLPAEYVPVIEELAKIDASTAWCLNQNSGCSMTAAHLAPEVAREIFGGPRGILAWGPGPGEAHRVAGGYRVTARWAFASGSHHATWLGCHVPVIEADGKPLLHDGWHAGRAHLAVPEERDQIHRHLAHDRAARHRQRRVRDQGFVRAGGLFPRRVVAARDARKGEDRLLYRFSSLALMRGGICRGGARHRARHPRPFHRAGARQDSARRPRDDAQQQRDPAQTARGGGADRARPGGICWARSRTSPPMSASAAISLWTSG